MVDRAELGRRLTGHAELVVGLLLEADGAEHRRVAGHRLHGVRHRVGVDAPGEEGPQGHLRHEAVLDHPVDPLEDLPRLGRLALLVEGQVPVALDPHPVPRVPGEHAAGGEALHPHPGAVLAPDVALDQVVEERLPAHLPVRHAGGEDRLHLAAEEDPLGGLAPVEGLDAEAVTADHDPRTVGVAPVRDREGEHAHQGARDLEHPLGRSASGGHVLAVEVQDRLDVRAGLEAGPVALQALAELAEVVDLPVPHHRELALAGLDRLVPAGQVDDGEPTEPQPEGRPQAVALVVRAAVHERPVHALEHPAVLLGEAARSAPGVEPESGEATHAAAPP